MSSVRERIAAIQKDPLTVAERLLARVHKTESCWLWCGARDQYGYGQMRVHNKLRKTHRIAYEQFVGSIPEGKDLDHLCRVPACCNPAHLEPVTHLENMRRGKTATKTHCKNGHPLSGDNLLSLNDSNGRPYRYCRICRRDHWRKWDAANIELRRARIRASRQRKKASA